MPWKNPRFELPNVANTVEMAASSSKMLQKQGNRTEQEIQLKILNGTTIKKQKKQQISGHLKNDEDPRLVDILFRKGVETSSFPHHSFMMLCNYVGVP